MIRRNTSLDDLATIFLVITILAIIGALAFLGIRALTLNRQAADVIVVPDDYATIQAAISAATAGDIIQVKAGIYTENLTLDKPVSLIAQSFDQINPVNNTTILDGGTGGAAILIPAGLTQMPVIHGFVIQNGVDAINAQSEFIAEYNYFHSSTNLVNYQMGAGGINRNNVYFNARDDAIHVDNTNRPLLIESNRIMYAADDGIEINLQDTSAPPAIIDVAIWNNMIIGSGEDGIQFIDFGNATQDTNRRFVIMGNLIANNTKAGIGLMPNANSVEDYSGADTAEAIRAFHNTFFGNDYGISGGDNVVAFNSIIVNSITRGVWNVQGVPEANSVVAYTLFHNNRIDAEQSVLGAGIISGQDPLFQAAPNPGPDGAWKTVDDDFSGLLLRSGSPAIDKGVTQYIAKNGEPIPPAPLTGFLGAAPDLGWREFGSPFLITPTASVTPSITPIASLTPVTPTVSPIATFTLPVSPTSISPTSPATVTPVPPTALPSATLPVATSTATITATPQLTIASIFPNSAQAGSTVNLTITGSAFVNGAVVIFEGGQGPAPQITTATVVNPTTIVITVNVNGDATLGNQLWDVRVTNPDTSTTILADAFTVTP
jgi:hypothetical protein